MAAASKQPDSTQDSPSLWQGTAQERENMGKDTARLTRFELYKAPFKNTMIDGIRKFQMKAAPLADKRISNVVIPLVRMVCDSCITSMSAGNPSFNVKPRALSDYPKINILEPAIEQVLEETNFDAVQNTFLTDGIVMGTAGLEVATQVPQRKDENGNPVRDYSRPRIEIRARSGLEMSFDPSLRNHSQKGAIHWQDRIGEDTFEEDYRIVTLSDGTKKYKNTEAVKPGIRMSVNPAGMVLQRGAGMYDYKGVVIDHVQDPLQNFYRIYANNIPIFDKPLYMRRKGDGTHTEGDNALGDTRICVWNNNDMYDDNDTTHALYGGGEPWLIWGLDRMYQDFGNMMVDNYALANTFGLSFDDGGQAHAGTMDLDSTDFYSGMFINSKIVVTPFGEVRLEDFQNVKEILDRWAINLTGVNFDNLVGEQGSTAFEVASKIRAGNRRYEYKLKKLSDTVYKKLGKLIVSSIFTTYTVDDFEIVTGESRDAIAEKFANGDIAQDDLVMSDVGGKKMITGLKHKTMVKIPGKVYTEKLGGDKKRKLDGSIDSTLSEDVAKRGKADSFVPAAEEYIVTLDYAERGALPGIIVDTGPMIAGKEQVDQSNLEQITQYAIQRVQMAASMGKDAQGQEVPGIATKFDLAKLDERMVELRDVSPESVFLDEGQDAEQQQHLDEVDKTLSMMEKTLQTPSQPPHGSSNSQVSGPTTQVQGGGPAYNAAGAIAGEAAGPPGHVSVPIPQAPTLGSPS